MKKMSSFLFASLLFCCAMAQQPATQIQVQGNVVTTNNYYEIVRELDALWDANPHRFEKGSGYKPYQRWKEYWQYYLNADGTLMTSADIAAQYTKARAGTKPQGKSTAKTTAADLSDWKPLGPYTHKNKGSWSSGQGRINITAIDPSNPNTIYVGTPNGGLWRSKDAGATWAVLNDTMASIGVSGIAIHPTNPNIIYLSTGDEDGSDSYTAGVYKTIDGGSSWAKLSYPFSPNSLSGEILINPQDPNMLWIVGANGLYKTKDAGTTWVRKINTLTKEIRLNPKNPNTVYVVEKTGARNTIFKSTDAGETFAAIDTYQNSGRVVMAVTRADTNYIYTLVSNASGQTFRALYRSTNGGISFTTQNDTANLYNGSGQAYYDLAIAVSDMDANTVFTGCIDVWKSVNGGVKMTKNASWNNPTSRAYTHADIHDLKFYNGKLYCSSDGGIYISSDMGVNFSDKTKNGLNISQFYRIDVAQSDSVNVVGGLQDNGGYSYANNAWINFHGADGMDAAIIPTMPNIHYGFIQFGGSMYGYDISDPIGMGFFETNDPAGETGNWITPLEAGNSGSLYAGYKKLYIYTGTAFSAVNPFTFSANLRQIRVHPTNDLEVLVSDGVKLYRSDGTFTFGFKHLNTLPLTSVKNFDYNRNNPSIIYAVGDAGVYQSIDTGNTWKNITYSLPGGSRNAIIHQASSTNNTVYLATNKAVYYINDSLTDWQLYSNNLPNTTITDIEVNNVENHVIISTYGRGVWRTAAVPEALAIEQRIMNGGASVTLYPNPVTNIAQLSIGINEPVVLNVYNTMGAIVWSKKYSNIEQETKFDFSALSSGTYIATFISETHLISKKFIKN